jgi:hypothetical protein
MHARTHGRQPATTAAPSSSSSSSSTAVSTTATSVAVGGPSREKKSGATWEGRHPAEGDPDYYPFAQAHTLPHLKSLMVHS